MASVHGHESSNKDGQKENSTTGSIKECSTIGGLGVHMKSAHNKDKPFRCNLCDFYSKERTKLREHIKSVHKGQKPITCYSCRLRFASRQDMNGHILSVHQGYKLTEQKRLL